MANLHKLSELRELSEFLTNLSLEDNFKDVAENLINSIDDFEIDNYRFISVDEIDNIQVEELKSDSYLLGCFNADFIADNSSLSYDIVKALQEGEQYDAIGEHLIDNDNVEEIQQEYSRIDGYGHHFAHYDHNEHVLNTINFNYLVFRIN